MEDPHSTRSTSPYRSRLLSFLRRQYIHWQDRSQTLARHARTAGIWGVQALLYPAYLLLSGGRRLLGGRTDRAAADAPEDLETTLAIVSAELVPATKLQALACDYRSRTPVAIAADGRVVRLPAALQRLLRPPDAGRSGPLARFVSWMRASPLARSLDLLGESRPAPTSAADTASLLDLWSPPTPQEPFSLQVLIQAAITYFFGNRNAQQLKSGRAGGAIARSEFGPEVLETALAIVNAELVPTTPLQALACDFRSRAPIAIAQDGQIVSLPAALQQQLTPPDAGKRGLLAWFVSWMRGGSSLALLGQSRSLPGKAADTASLLDLWSPPTPQEPFSLRVLVQAAIAYFFGGNASKQIGAASRAEFQAARGAVAFVPSEFGPWLDYEDLFPPSLVPAEPDTSRPELAGADESVALMGQDPERFLVLPDVESAAPGIVGPEEATFGHREPADGPELEVAATTVATTADPERADIVEGISADLDGESEPMDYLDVRAVTDGYVKHPLEIVMGWLDRIVSWIEDRLLGLWNGVRQQVARLLGGDRDDPS